MSARIFVSVSDPIFDTISAQIRKVYPHACVVFIDRIENNNLAKAFEERKKLMAEARGKDPKVMTLFHGTKKDNINSICSTGFKVGYNRTSAYGKGTYFATDPKMSLGYTDRDDDDLRHVFVCKVLVGATAPGRSGGEPDRSKIDNFVSGEADPAIIVSVWDDAVLPEYIVGFYTAV